MLKLNLYHKDEYSRARTVERIKLPGLKLHCTGRVYFPGVFRKRDRQRRRAKETVRTSGLPLEQTIAVGDADNDTMALKTAGLSIAMGNATEPIKLWLDVI